MDTKYTEYNAFVTAVVKRAEEKCTNVAIRKLFALQTTLLYTQYWKLVGCHF